jgi:hypothetical protein
MSERRGRACIVIICGMTWGALLDHVLRSGLSSDHRLCLRLCAAPSTWLSTNTSLQRDFSTATHIVAEAWWERARCICSCFHLHLHQDVMDPRYLYVRLPTARPIPSFSLHSLRVDDARLRAVHRRRRRRDARPACPAMEHAAAHAAVAPTWAEDPPAHRQPARHPEGERLAHVPRVARPVWRRRVRERPRHEDACPRECARRRRPARGPRRDLL